MRSGEDMARHVLAEAQHVDVQHACPECVIGATNTFCSVCFGSGLVSTDRLDAYLAAVQRAAR